LANVLGLNVSASFNSAKVIYIMIPVLIIPQLLFSGVIVKFDKLHPWFSSERSVPWIGNIMASRWAYEGLAVTQFKENRYETMVYELDRRMKQANWRKDLWVPELRNAIGDVRAALNGQQADVDVPYELGLIRTELESELQRLRGASCPALDRLTPTNVNPQVLTEVEGCLDVLVHHYRSTYRDAEREKDAFIARLTSTDDGRKAYFALLDSYRNESLADIVTNRNDVNVIVESDGRLVQKSDPIYRLPEQGWLLSAHFYAPSKWLFGKRIPTIWANVLVLWLMSFALALALHLDLFPRLLRLMPSRPGR
jgi:hypothetical protein